jgi:GxxExxY protein
MSVPLVRATSLHENQISSRIIAAAIEVHRVLGGPGLLEIVYEEALAKELKHQGLVVSRQVPVPVYYKGEALEASLRIDLLVEGRVIVECKSTTEYHSIFETQTLTYLRITNLRLGLVINFGEKLVRDGVHRVVNGLRDQE